MEPKRNYQKEMEKVLAELPESSAPRLLLHACCAPCSSYVLEYLSDYFEITVLYYNPNISPETEYRLREEEARRLASVIPRKYPIHFMEGTYAPERFFAAVRGHEMDPEGGERCGICFRIRLMETARIAAEGKYDYFTTSLTISPLKDAGRLNRIGEEVGKLFGAEFLPSDFKKRNGYRRSVELSKEYGLYRQNYCGCVYSRREAEERERKKNDGQV